MKAQEIMTESPDCCTPEDTLQSAAHKMTQSDCGCLPVVRDLTSRELVGVITDRDIACRGVAAGKGAETLVSEVMSTDVSCCTTESDMEEVEQIMAGHQVRRVPVIDSKGCCVGIIAQADIARDEEDFDDREVRSTLESISEPSPDSRSASSVGTHINSSTKNRQESTLRL